MDRDPYDSLYRCINDPGISGMNDSLNVAQEMAGIPDAGVRLVIAAIVIFVLAVTVLLLYSRMQELDKK